MSTLPHFIIIGTQKGGTSSLYNYLCQHPMIDAAARKEVHFFDTYFAKGVEWYKEQFPIACNGHITGEASPYYLFHPHAAERIAETVPEIKLIVLLRNPSLRAYSHHNFMQRRGIELLNFEEALAEEGNRTADEWDKLLSKEIATSPPVQQFSYRRRGLYQEQLLRYWKRFPRENIMIESSEELFEKPGELCKKAFEFLGVDHSYTPEDLLPRKSGGYSLPNEKSLDKLFEYYKPYNEALFKELKKQFNWHPPSNGANT